MKFAYNIRLPLISAAIGAALLVSPFSAFASTATIQNISPGTTVTPGNEITFNVVGAGFGSALTYSVSDSFGSAGTVNNNDINNSGVFVWIPTNADSGVHNLTISVTDQSNDTAYAYQQITVQGPPTVSIQSLSPSASIKVGQTVTFTAAGTNFTNPTYIASDAYSGTSMTAGAMTSTGGFSWTPLAQDVGSHTITITGQDSLGDTGSVVQTITVNPSASISIGSVLPGASVVVGSPLTFSVTQSGFTNPTYSVYDSFTSNSVTANNINSSGNFNWTPLSTDLGTHSITVYATDSTGQNANTNISIAVINATTTTTTTVPTTITTSASALTVSQIQAIISLLQSFGADATVVANVQATLTGQGTVTAPSTSTHATNDGYRFLDTLSFGSKGTAVTELQTRLTAEGEYTGPITGYFGALTQTAVMAYQGAQGLPQVGVVGPATRAKLNASL